MPLGKLHTWEVATWENCRLGITPLEKYLTPFIKRRLEEISIKCILEYRIFQREWPGNLKEEIKIENVDIKEEIQEEILLSSTVENTCNVCMKEEDVKNESQGKP